MIKRKKNNIFRQVSKLFLKYKIASIFYLVIVMLVYPVNFFFNDYNTKNYTIKFNYIKLLPSTDHSYDGSLNINNYNKKIYNELQKQIIKTNLLRENVSIKCTLVEYTNTCKIKLKNWTEKNANLLKGEIINGFKAVSNDSKNEIKQQINMLDKSLESTKATNETLDFNYNNNKESTKNSLEISNLAIESMKFKLQVVESINNRETQLMFLKSSIIYLESFEKEIIENISLSFLHSKDDFNSFENYSLKKHLLTIIIGISFLFFGFLILIN